MDTHELEDRTLNLARRVRDFVQRLPRTLANRLDARQLLRTSGAAGSQFVAANEAPTKRDFVDRLQLAREETSLCRYWLKLVDVKDNAELEVHRDALIQECTDLLSVFADITEFDIRYLRF